MSDNDIGKPQKRPPTWAEVVGRLHPLFGIVALVEYPTGWWVWLWRSSTGMRTLIEFAGAAIIFAGIIGLYLEREDRKEDRSTRNAQLIAQIESLAAINNPKNADPGVRVVMEFAAREKVSMARISVQGVDLNLAELSGANLNRAILSKANFKQATLSVAELFAANLREANLVFANLSGANLQGANLREADFFFATLSGANFSKAKLSGANLSWANIKGARNLTQAQIDVACVKKNSPPPKLPDGLNPPTKICPKR